MLPNEHLLLLYYNTEIINIVFHLTILLLHLETNKYHLIHDLAFLGLNNRNIMFNEIAIISVFLFIQLQVLPLRQRLKK